MPRTHAPLGSPAAFVPAREEPALRQGRTLPLLVGLALLALPFFCVVFALSGFAVGRGIGAYTLPLAVAAAGAVTFLAAWRAPGDRLTLRVGALSFAGLIVTAAFLAAPQVWDTTWDGQWFHQEAVLQLADGWNPLERPLDADDVPLTGARARINGYPAASWLYGAAAVAATGRLETGKAFSAVLMAAAFFLAWAALLDLRRLPAWVAFLLALLLAANPVALTQALNFQHDGDLASALLAVAATGLLLVRRGSRSALAAFLMAATLGVGIKLTGVPFVAIAVAALGTAHFVLHRRWPRRRALVATGIGGALVALSVVHPYATNLVRFGHPLYPYAGPNAPVESDPQETGLLTPDPAPAVEEAGLLERPVSLVYSIFSRSSHSSDSGLALAALMRGERLKIPFRVEAAEWEVFHLPDVRIGGWGPLFGGMVLLGVLAALLAGGGSRELRWTGFAAAAILVSALLVPHPWFARYVPQVWCLPFLAVPVAFAARRRPAMVVAVLVLALGATNAVAVAHANVVGTIRNHRGMKTLLTDLGRTDSPLRVNLTPFRSYRARLEELGIPVQEVDDQQRSLGVPMGYFSPPRVDHGLVERAGGGTAAVVQWRRLVHASHYRLQVVEPPPRGPGGGALSVVEREVQGSIVELPLPVGMVHLLLSTCNELGCGPPRLIATYDVPPPAPPAPVFGAPAPGSTLPSSGVLLSWVPVEAPAEYRLQVRTADGATQVLDITTENHFWPVDLAPDSRYTATVTALRGDGELGSDEIHFDTTTPTAPRPTLPVLDSTLPEGDVVIGWTAVPGATSYDYFVAVQGEPHARHRGETAETFVQIDLEALEDRATTYSVTVRACSRELCAQDGDWGPWSINAGTGVTNFTVVPAPE